MNLSVALTWPKSKNAKQKKKCVPFNVHTLLYIHYIDITLYIGLHEILLNFFLKLPMLLM